MSDLAIAVFTAKDPDELLRQGGSGPWVGAEARVKAQKYLVCVRKTKPGSTDHGTLFMVSRIKGVVEHGYDKRGQQRWFFQFGDYALIDVKTHWAWRNPVKYTTLGALEINIQQLKFRAGPTEIQLPAVTNASVARPLTIAEAKAGLAAKFGISPDAIDIIIKG